MSISDFITKTGLVLFAVVGLFATVKLWRGHPLLTRGFYERPDPVARFFNSVYGFSPLGYLILTAGILVMVLGLVAGDVADALGLGHLLFIPTLVIVCLNGARRSPVAARTPAPSDRSLHLAAGEPVNDGLTRYATGDRQVFRRRTGGWEVELLPGWDSVEDILGAALVSREPRREGAAFRSNINVVESPEILPEDLYTYSEQQAELLREAGVEPHDLMVRLPDENESSLKPGQMAVRVQSRSNIQGAIVEQETIWVGLGSASLIFTLMAEEAEYEAKQEAMLSVPRSLKLHPSVDADGNQVIG